MTRRMLIEIGPGAENGHVRATAAATGDANDGIFAEGPARAAVADVLGTQGTKHRVKVEVLIRPPLVQVRTLSGLPPVRERDLVRLIAEQADRFFRPIAGTPCASAVWCTRDDGERVARAALAEMELLAEIQGGAESAGGSVDRILARSDPDEGAELSFRTPAMVERIARATRRQWIAMAAVALTGWAIPAGVYVGDLGGDYRALQGEVAVVGPTLERMDSLEARLSDFTEIASVLRAAESRWATETLSALAADIPEGVHLHSLSLDRDGRVRLSTHPEDVALARAALQDGWPGPEPIVEERR